MTHAHEDPRPAAKGSEAEPDRASSLIICSRGRPQLLLDLLQSILAGDELPSEIVVIDDSDQANQALSRLQPETVDLRYVWNRSRGLSRAVNKGAELARHDWLLFTQDDVLVEPDWFGSLLRAQLRAGADTVITGAILPGEVETEGGFAPSTIVDEEPREYSGRTAVDVLYMQNAAFHRSVGDAVGWFDPRIGPGTPYPTAEDNDFGHRVLEAGYRIRYEPTAVTHHRAWRGTDDLLETRWNYGRGQGAFLAKHARLRNPLMLRRLLGEVAYMGARAFARIFYRPRGVLPDLAYFGGLVTAILQWRLSR